MEIKIIEGKKVAEINGKLFDFEPLNTIIVECPTKNEKSKIISVKTGLVTTDENQCYYMDEGVTVLAKPKYISDIEVGDKVFFIADNKKYKTKVSHIDTQNDLVGSEDMFKKMTIGDIDVAVIDYRQIIGVVRTAKVNYTKFYNDMIA